MLDKRDIFEYFFELDKLLTKKTDICLIGGSYFVMNHLKSSSKDIDIIVENNYAEVNNAISQLKHKFFDVDLLSNNTLGNYVLPKNYMKTAKQIKRNRSKFRFIKLWLISMYDIIVSKIVRWNNKDKEDILTIFKHRNIYRHRLEKRIRISYFPNKKDFEKHYSEFIEIFGDELKEEWHLF